jgi:hypothetical protein
MLRCDRSPVMLSCSLQSPLNLRDSVPDRLRQGFLFSAGVSRNNPLRITVFRDFATV